MKPIMIMFRIGGIRIWLAVIFFSLVGGYAYSTSHDFLAGPTINLRDPAADALLTNDQIVVAGTAERIAKLYLNGRQIFTDELGNFTETIILQTGYNQLEIRAIDKFGRETKVNRSLVLKS